MQADGETTVIDGATDNSKLIEDAGGVLSVHYSLRVSIYTVNAWLNGSEIPPHLKDALQTICNIRRLFAIAPSAE